MAEPDVDEAARARTPRSRGDLADRVRPVPGAARHPGPGRALARQRGHAAWPPGRPRWSRWRPRRASTSRIPRTTIRRPLGKLATPALAPRLDRLLARLASLEPWTEAELEGACRQLAGELGVKLVDLAQPIRLALTGETASPPIFGIMADLGPRDDAAPSSRVPGPRAADVAVRWSSGWCATASPPGTPIRRFQGALDRAAVAARAASRPRRSPPGSARRRFDALYTSPLAGRATRPRRAGPRSASSRSRSTTSARSGSGTGRA